MGKSMVDNRRRDQIEGMVLGSGWSHRENRLVENKAKMKKWLMEGDQGSQ
jgi:hypothetical protein